MKQQIKTNNTTQEWVSGKIDVPLGTFKKWLTRKTYPDVREGVELARLLHTTVEFLVTGVDVEGLSPEEEMLLKTYRKLNRQTQENVRVAMEAWCRNPAWRG